MSRKTKTTATKEEARPALVPKLRFPEFRDADEWKIEKIDELVDTVTPPKKLPTSNYAATGAFPIIDQSQSAICGWTDDNDALIQDDLPLIVFGDHTCILKLIDRPFAQGADGIKILKSRPKIGTSFLYQFLNYRPVVTEEYKRHYSILKEKLVAFPDFKTGEQQKIAECLSSVDELMAAQARKLDALKIHKKGLMQQLFPREGETQPRLRFPEFQNAGDWVVKPLGEIFPITSSKRVHESDWTPTGVPFYRAREIVALNKHELIQPLFIGEELYAAYSKLTGEIRDGHLLVTGVGSIGVPYLVRSGDRFYFKDGNIIWLKNDGKELSGEFLHRLYETDYIQKQLKAMADVGTVATYTIDSAKRTLAVFPPDKDEQQRIAACLSSLDALITAETQKHEALKTHKKGLMQQLFPSPEDTNNP